MHEYLHKYFENIQENEKILFMHNTRPLGIVSSPGRECGGLFLRLWTLSQIIFVVIHVNTLCVVWTWTGSVPGVAWDRF